MGVSSVHFREALSFSHGAAPARGAAGRDHAMIKHQERIAVGNLAIERAMDVRRPFLEIVLNLPELPVFIGAAIALGAPQVERPAITLDRPPARDERAARLRVFDQIAVLGFLEPPVLIPVAVAVDTPDDELAAVFVVGPPKRDETEARFDALDEIAVFGLDQTPPLVWDAVTVEFPDGELAAVVLDRFADRHHGKPRLDVLDHVHSVCGRAFRNSVCRCERKE